MRIIGGRHRGRRIKLPEGLPVRPTSDRAREAIFNLLEHGRYGAAGTSIVRDARVLDVFCGTGLLAFEALSRGGASATLVDVDARVLQAARQLAGALGETGAVRVVEADAADNGSGGLGRATQPHDLVFLDPPYDLPIGLTALETLTRRGWLAEGAVVVLERPAGEPIQPPLGFTLLDRRRYGAAQVMLMRRTE